MSEPNSAKLEQTATALRISFPTEPRERWRVAGSHAGTVPVSVGELFRQADGVCSQAQARRLTLLVLAYLLIYPMAACAIDSSPATKSVLSRSQSVSWYFQSGQWRADIRTIKAACEFLLDDETAIASPTRNK